MSRCSDDSSPKRTSSCNASIRMARCPGSSASRAASIARSISVLTFPCTATSHDSATRSCGPNTAECLPTCEHLGEDFRAGLHSAKSAIRLELWRLKSVSMNKYWGIGCAFNGKRPRLAILARCWMRMNAQNWSVCAVRTPNYVWTVSF
jgi:hypothetical protein